jgi:hypothetical protein
LIVADVSSLLLTGATVMLATSHGTHRSTSFGLAIAFLAALAVPPLVKAEAPSKASESGNVILVLVDGLRTQEMFAGADERLLNKEAGGVPDPEGLKKQFWRDTPEARREVLMPFMWGTIARKGQVFGNQAKGCAVQLSNTFWFSYPGYSEMFVGYADPAIDSNDKRPNPNVTVFEWLNGRPGFKGRVAGFGAWDVVDWILNRDRCGFPVNAGFDPMPDEGNAQLQLLNRLKAEVPAPWDGEPYDAITLYSAIEHIKVHKPRATVITLGETDGYGHDGRYDRYLDAAKRTDGFLKTLWETVQAIPEYRDRTTLIVATDHGRGSSPSEWRSHGSKLDGSQYVWVALFGPATPALGERSDVPSLKLAQVAATVAAAVGEDYTAAVAKAAPVLDGAIRRLAAAK